jgi:hypothetical protein
MPAHRAEALNRETRAAQLHAAEAGGHLGGVAHTPAGGADLVQGNSAEFGR